MLITNGTCVSRIMMSSAGSRGSRRRHDSLSGLRVTFFGPIDGLISSGRIVVLMASAVPVPRTSALGCLGRDVLAVLQRGVDRRPSRDHRRELLGALVAHVLELRDAHVLHAR